ncbi:hypothetical protein HanPSC8_Chr13g0557371 [Helianthus annuus]|nr:hypothetical protein HanPSC8_Chr13g0557371 [Helianthus annuus]
MQHLHKRKNVMSKVIQSVGRKCFRSTNPTDRVGALIYVDNRLNAMGVRVAGQFCGSDSVTFFFLCCLQVLIELVVVLILSLFVGLMVPGNFRSILPDSDENRYLLCIIEHSI